MKFKETEFISMVPYIRDRKGHHFFYQTCLKEIFDSQKISYRGYISTYCNPIDIPPEWIKIFSRMRYRYRDFVRIFDAKTQASSRIFFIDVFYGWDLFFLCLAMLTHSRSNDFLWLFFRHPLPKQKHNPYSLICRILYRKLGPVLFA